MDYKQELDGLKRNIELFSKYGYMGFVAHQKRCAKAITDLLARAETAEAQAEKAEAELKRYVNGPNY